MSSLKLNSDPTGEYNCSTCCEDYNTVTDKPWQTKDAELVCAGCIIHIFEQALENDYSWPPRFGPDVLLTQDFASILPNDLLHRATERAAADKPRVDPEEAARAVKGLVRGKDYQICPGCSHVFALGTGCNHIVCLCNCPLCFLCGKMTLHDDDHFKRGGCPRFGQPEKVIFDNPDPVAVAREAHNTRIQQRLARDLLGFHAESWMWNVAIQTFANGDHTRFVMVDLLRGNPQRLYWMPTADESALVLKAMRAKNLLHCVPDEQWDRIAADFAGAIERFVTEGPKGPRRDTTRHPAVTRGFLSQPVSGLFNMATQSGRVAAFMWMHDSIRGWKNINYRSVTNVAVFDMGPADGDETRHAGAILLAFLYTVGEQHTRGRFSFELMAGNALLVELKAPLPVDGRPDALLSEAFWRQELLTTLWHRMAYPDGQPVAGDEQWTRMWRKASDAWYEQTGTPMHNAL
jgi:hypothetical protein